MAKKEKRALGAVAFNEDAMILIAQALTGNEASTDSNAQCASFNEKIRWAYLLVGYKESQELRKANKDNESLLDAIKSKYAPLVKSAIDENAVSERSKIKQQMVVKSGKHINLVQSVACSSTSLEGLLKVYHMNAQAKTLDAVHKEKGAMRTRMVLPFSTKECHKLIQKEKGKTEGSYKHHAFAVVAWAYGYKGEDDKLELIKAQNPIVALLPKIRFECGLFFDGTNNNKFNTQMRLDYERYLENKHKIIDANNAPEESLERLIMSKDVPKSKVLPLIFKDLKENIGSYGHTSISEKKYDGGSWFFGMWQDKVSYDADKIYDYFRDEDSKEVDEFIVDELLPSGKDSSYTGDDTNVVKLYDLYNTQVNNSSHKEQHLYKCYRKKLYITGAGTYDSRKTGKKEEDEVFRGSALAMFSTGVVTKVEQACKDLRRELKGFSTGYIDTLVLDVFGFSRGAAEARHFVGSISKELDTVFEREVTDKKGKTYIEYELSKNGENLYPYLIKEGNDEKDQIIIDRIIFRFVGIFDTVPHYGLIQKNDAEDLDLKLHHKKVSRVVHLTAQQEYRYNFDLFSIKTSSSEQLPKHFEEKEFFGAHSDVGGGYGDDNDELRNLPTQFFHDIDPSFDKKVISKLKKWNKLYSWVKDAKFEFINNKKEFLKDIESKKIADGFYIDKWENEGDENMEDDTTYYIYMYRKSIDAEYAQIPFEYMFEKAKKLVPMKNLGKLTYKNMKELEKTKVLDLDDAYLKKFKSQFLHHSSTSGIAHHPNSGDENILYGKRDVHYV
ncbi:phospholipase effector Tle1 domain-containing protein [Sulfurimonas sp.]|uniref:phospholipase effector Tle1 domain-containing protein n=1 Tax=Sulfurimonas sp. TaxID=2022749 RepID=UPI002B45D9CA|nr:DUF2235 domain-containing protein [Sulfurimonas sp.]